jgi:Family of unknown function (DUF6518)
LLVAVIALAVGVLTAYSQEWLPPQVHSLANSAGSWTLIAFALALMARTARMSAIFGCLALLMMLVGYVLGAGVRGDPSSEATVASWGLTSVVVGPLLGLGAYWVKTRRYPLAAVGIGAVSGVLIGEGIYGLTQIADTTYPPYWWGQIFVGSLLLVAVAWRRPRSTRSAALSLGVAALTAALFVLIYNQGPANVLGRG